MSDDHIEQDGPGIKPNDLSSTEIRPGESLYTPEWDALIHPKGRKRKADDLAFAGICGGVITTMILRGWRTREDLPAPADLAQVLHHPHTRQFERLLERLHAIPEPVFDGQLRRTRRWPAWVIVEFSR